MQETRKKVDIYFIIILVLALFLYGWGTWNAGSANSYYTAAITSMVQSWHNFFYGAFDPAGFITVDKPPIALWFMAISAKLFGIHGWSIVLPSVLFGVGSVWLLYKMVKPTFGILAARLSALALTLTPIVVADSRTNNMDATLVFFLILAGYCLMKAVQTKKAWLVFASFALIGIGFNIKMLQAFMILPAMYLFYWIAFPAKWKKKLLHTIIATVFLAVFTLAYPLAVDYTNKADRPYVGSSQKNSLLELAFGYNGTERLLGQSTGTGGTFAGMGSKNKAQNGAPGASAKSNKNTKPSGKNAPPSGKNSSQKPGNGKAGSAKGGAPGNFKGKNNTAKGGGNQQNPPTGMKRGGGGQGAGGGAFNIGTAGPLRLIQSELGPQISWLLPFSLIGFFAAFFIYRNKKNRWYQLSEKQKHLTYWLAWLVPVAGFFSIASFFHPYYMIMLAPPIAALFGISGAMFYKQLKQGLLTNWKQIVLTISVIATAMLQITYVWSYYKFVSILIGIAAIILLLLLWLPKGTLELRKRVLGAILALLLVAPGYWALTPTLANESAAIPTAGPDLLTSSGNAGSIGNESIDTGLANYLLKHQGNAKYLFATTDANSASPYIIKTKKAVMAIGGYNGTDPAITLKEFKKLVKNGELKYFYVSGRNNNSSIIKWVKANSKKISSSKYSTTKSATNKVSGGQKAGGPGGGMGNSGTLYQLND